MTRKQKIAKLRKCLALSKSSNEHEAAAALEVARRMMVELQMSEADAALLDIEEQSARGSRCLRPAAWESLLAATVSRAIGCARFIDENGDWRFVGRGSAAEIAAYAFQVLYRNLKAARSQYTRTKLRRCKLANKRIRADAFCEGWANAVYAKVRKLAPAFEDALVEQYLAERHSDLSVVENRAAKLKAASNDFFNGAAGGRSIDLHAGMGTAAAPLLANA